MKIIGYIDHQKEALRQLRQLEDGALRDKVFSAIQKGAEKVAVEAIHRVPVDKGPLLRSIKTGGSKKTMTAKVYADYPDTARTRRRKTKKQAAGSREYYAMAMEYGTRHVKAQPFLMPAGEAKAKEITEDLEKAMEEVLRDTGSTL